MISVFTRLSVVHLLVLGAQHLLLPILRPTFIYTSHPRSSLTSSALPVRPAPLFFSRLILIRRSRRGNQVLRYLSDLRIHPGLQMLKMGLPVTISSDDPGIWGARGLSHDFWEARGRPSCASSRGFARGKGRGRSGAAETTPVARVLVDLDAVQHGTI